MGVFKSPRVYLQEAVVQDEIAITVYIVFRKSNWKLIRASKWGQYFYAQPSENMQFTT